MSLIYNKTNWKDDKTTPVNARNLNNIEDGVEYIYHKWDKIIQDSTTGDHAAELIDARYGPNDVEQYPTLGHRLNHMDEKNIIINSRIEQMTNMLGFDARDFKCNNGEYVKGDGIHNDTIGIQNAIDYVNSIGGGNLIISNGIFMIDASVGVQLKSNVNLIFNNAKLKAIPNNLTHYKVLYIFDTKNNYILNANIEGERDQHTGSTGEMGYGIYIQGNVKNVTFDNLTISNCWGDGILTQRHRVGGSNYIDYIPNNINFNGVTEISNCRRQGISILAGENIFINSLICKDINGTLPMAGIDIESEHSVDLIGNIRINYLKTIRCAKCFTMRTRSRITGNISIGTLEHLEPIPESWGGHNVYVAPFRVMYEYFNTSQANYTVSADGIYTDVGGVQLENLYKGCTPKVIIGNVYSKDRTYISTADPSGRGLVNIVWTLDTDLSNILGGLVINKILYENIHEISDRSINIRPYIITYAGSKPINELSLTDVKIDSISFINLDDNVKVINPLSNVMFENVNIKHGLQRTQISRQDSGNKTVLVEDGNKYYFVPITDGSLKKYIYLRVFNCLTNYEVITKGLTELIIDTKYNTTYFEKVYLNGDEIPVSSTEGIYIVGTFSETTNFFIKTKHRYIYIETI